MFTLRCKLIQVMVQFFNKHQDEKGEIIVDIHNRGDNLFLFFLFLGMDNHDNKIIRPRAYKKRQVNCSQNLVPRDPSSGKFVCELCGGTFTNRSSYFRHKRIHGEKKFRCFLCDKAFHRKEHLQSHIHRHTKSFPLKCCQCNYESHSLDEASSHFQTTHNQDFKESP